MNKKQTKFLGIAILIGGALFYFLSKKKTKPPLKLTPEETKQLEIELNPANRGRVAPVISKKILEYQKG